MDLNFKHESEEFSEGRIEELLRSGNWAQAVVYRADMSTDLLNEARDYVGRVAKRIGVAVPGDGKPQTLSNLS